MREIEVVGYEGLYTVNEEGRVFSIRSNRFLNESLTKGGYKRVLLSKDSVSKLYLVHRVVALSFSGIPLHFSWKDNPIVVCHINDITSDNRLDNLFIGTQSDNVLDMINKGRGKKTCPSFRKMKNARLSESDIFKIMEMHSKGIRNCDISREFNINPGKVTRILQGKLYGSAKYKESEK